jgi:phosphoribosylformylglycinamidine synthase
VSFYNESPKGAIYPTPSVGLAGIVEDVDCLVPSYFQKEGDFIFLVGQTRNEIGGSQYLLAIHGKREGRPPVLDLDRELALQKFLLAGAKAKIFRSAHDLSEGGLAIALAECLLGTRNHPLGCVVELNQPKDLRLDANLFGESQGRVILSISPENEVTLNKLAAKFQLPLQKLGRVEGKSLNVKGVFEISSAQIEDVYRGAIARRMKV